jgi:hypothetical protein
VLGLEKVDEGILPAGRSGQNEETLHGRRTAHVHRKSSISVRARESIRDAAKM